MDKLLIYIGWAASSLILIRNWRLLTPTRTWLLGACALLLASVPVARVLGALGHDNYNLAEMLRTDKILPEVSLAFLFLWAPLTVRWAAALLTRKKRLEPILLAPASLFAAWGLLRRSATVESIWDILGAPVWQLPFDAEYIMRFAALYTCLLWLPLLFVAMARSRKGGIACMVFSCVYVIACPMLIQGYSHADNVRELFLPDGGYWFAGLCLLTCWAGALWARDSWRPRLATIILCAVAWPLLCVSIDVSAVHGLILYPTQFYVTFAVFVLCLSSAFGKVRRG